MMIKNKVRVKMLFAALCLCFVGTTASAQRNALKTNALYWATGTANLAYEYRLSPRWTLGTSVAWNSWCYYGKKERNRKIRHALVQPELRYYFCEAFSGHYVGTHLIYSHYNAGNVHMPFGIWKGLRDHRYQGDLGAVGVLYGYNWPISNHSSIEATLGVGVGITKFDKYDCSVCGAFKENETKVFFMPTKIALSYVYYFK